MDIDKRYTHHMLTRIRKVKPWYFLAAGVMSGTVCVVALRDNNLHMARLREAVYTADRDGKGVQQALQNLQVYVAAHMNTNVSTGPNAPYPPIQLEYTYDRAVQAAGEAASAANAKIYTDAQKHCEATIPDGFSGRYRIACVQAYVNAYGVALPTIPDALYKFAFFSPRWSPDLAGWSMVVAVLSLLGFVGMLLLQWWLRRITR
jgi:hypothetical protein